MLFRATLSEGFGDGEVLLNNSDLLHIHDIRAPYAFVRFARLRLSVRIVAKAPIGLICLITKARGAERSWLSALESDLKWLKLCDPKLSFSLSEWLHSAGVIRKK